MELYQRIVLGIAIILLISAYIMIYFTLVDNNKNWPPSVAKCPDFWVYDPTTDKCQNGSELYPEDIDIKLSQKSNCDNYTWAKNNNVSWEGLSYGVNIDCS